MAELDFEVRLETFQVVAENAESGQEEPYLLLVKVRIDNVTFPFLPALTPVADVSVQAIGNQDDLGSISEGADAGAPAAIPAALGRWLGTLRLTPTPPPVHLSDVEPVTLIALGVVALEEDNLSKSHVAAGRAELEKFIREKVVELVAGGPSSLSSLSTATIAAWKEEAKKRLTEAVTGAVLQGWKFTVATLPILVHEASNPDDFIGIGLAGPLDFEQLRRNMGSSIPFTLQMNNPEANEGTYRVTGKVLTRDIREQDPVTVAATWRGNRLDVIARGDDHKFYRSKWTGGDSWTPWNDVGAKTLISGPAAAARGENALDIVGLESDRLYRHAVYTGSGDPAWTKVEPNWPFFSAPALVARPNGELTLIGRGEIDRYHVSHRNPQSGEWSEWTAIGDGRFVTAPGACVRPNGVIDVFGVGKDRHAYWSFTGFGGWSGWKVLGGGTFTSAIAAIASGADRIDLFARGDNRKMYTARIQSGDPTQWKAIDPDVKATFLSAPAVVSRASGQFDLFAVGDDRRMYHNVFDGTKWSGWLRDTPEGTFV